MTNNTNKTTNDNGLILEKVQENWATLKGLVNRIENAEMKEGATQLCEDLHDRFAVAPASTRTDFVGCFPGGLVWHSLNVLRVMKAMRTSLDLEKAVHPDTLILLGLFHDVGKLGNSKEDYYLPQQSDWHRNKGMLYEINENLTQMPVSARSVWWLNQYNIPLSETEICALQSIAGKSNEQIIFTPSLKDPWEAFLLQSGVRGACIKHHGITSLSQT